jgi:hypothetical protein
MRIINEPTAAALAYGLNKKDKEQKNSCLWLRWRNIWCIYFRYGRWNIWS